MNVYHKWSKTLTKPFPGESEADLRRRSDEIDTIIDGFRWGRFSTLEAEDMELRLQTLQRPPKPVRRRLTGSH